MSDKHNDNDYTFERVPGSARKGLLPMFFIMLGFTFFSASMSVGATLGNGLTLTSFYTSVFYGGVLLSIYTGTLAYIGCTTGLSFDLLARRAFGSKGSMFPSFIIALTQSGWFGVGAAMFAMAGAQVVGCNRWVLIILAGVCMTTSAYFGIKGMEIVSYISVPLILVLGIFSVYKALNEGGGLMAVFEGHEDTMTTIEGIGLVVGSFVSGGTTTPNFARFAKGRQVAVFVTVVAFSIGNSLMFAFGAVGGAFTGKEDIFYVMIAQGLTIPALIVLGANIWTTNDNALYSCALGLSNITKVPKRPMVIVAGTFGTLASVWIYEHFVTWLTLLNAILPPIGAIIMIDFFTGRRHYRAEEDDKICVVNIGSIVGIIAGAVVGIYVKDFGITTINSMVTACFCYVIFNCRRLFRNNACK